MTDPAPDFNSDQVSLVRVPAEECDGCPDFVEEADGCPVFIYRLTIGGYMEVEALSPHGILNYINQFLPGLDEAMVEVRSALHMAENIRHRLIALRPDLEDLAKQEDLGLEPGPEAN